MLARLACRNVKRQIGNYLIYFITVSLTVALMFAVNNVIFSLQLLAYASAMQEFKSGLITITVFVALIVAFVLGYATSFMLKLRKREFGTYLTLGMTRKNILSIFLMETMIMCLAALIVGMLLGLVLYQGLMMIMANLMEMEFAFSTYSSNGLLLTVVLVLSMFILSSVTSAVYLKKVSIYQLIHGDQMVEKKVKHPLAWTGLMLLSLIAMVGSCIVFYREIDKAFLEGESSAGGVFGSLLVLAEGIILFHISLAKSVVNLMLRSRRFCSRGTNIFTLRQLSGKLSANAIMAGVLAFLISFAIIGANVSFVQKMSEEASLNQEYPFDITAQVYPDDPARISPDEAISIIEEFAPVLDTIPYTIYTTGNGYLYGFTQWSGEGYEGVCDSVISESDLNRLYAALGKDSIQLDGDFYILASYAQIGQYDFSDAQLELGGKTYKFAGISTDAPSLSNSYFIAVVPDEAVSGLTKEANCMAYNLGEGEFNPEQLRHALSYTYTTPNDLYSYERCDYHIREYGKLRRNSTSAVFVISALYIAVVFVFMAMAILALKTLSGLAEDRRRYQVLFRLGGGEGELKHTLFRQIFSFFFLPFAVPLLLSIPTGIICGHIMKLGGYPAQTAQVYIGTALIAMAMAALYILYFTATYEIARRYILRDKR